MKQLITIICVVLAIVAFTDLSIAGHGCPDSGHGTDPSGGNGNGHGNGGGDNDGDSGSTGNSGGNVGSGATGNGIGGDVDRSMMVGPKCGLFEWIDNDYNCPE